MLKFPSDEENTLQMKLINKARMQAQGGARTNRTTVPLTGTPKIQFEERVVVEPEQSVPLLQTHADEAEMESRVVLWKNLSRNENTDETVKLQSDVFNRFVELVCKEEQRHYNHSAAMLERAYGAYVPYYGVGIHDCVLRVEMVGSDKEVVQWQPDDAATAFGSYTHSEQTFLSTVSEVKHGDLTNAYLIQIKLGNITSHFPFSVGVEIGELKGEKSTFTPYRLSQKYYYAWQDRSEFHYVIPPYADVTGPIQVYRSTIDINNEYGQEYTFITEDKSTITKGCKQFGSDWVIPPTSPILRWVLTEYPGKDYGKEFQGTDENHWVISDTLMQAAIKAIQAKVRTTLPVRNLENFVVRLTPLMDSDVSTHLYERAMHLRGKEYDEKIGVSRGEIQTKLMRQKEIYALWFDMHFDIMYRDVAKTIVAQSEEVEKHLHPDDE